MDREEVKRPGLDRGGGVGGAGEVLGEGRKDRRTPGRPCATAGGITKF